MIQEKRGMFKNWNIALLMLMFASMIWGTAVVRSGILTSVHAFAQSAPGPYFLGFIVVVLTASAYLRFSRLAILRSDHKLDSWFSREGMFLIQNVIFASAALLVFIGTTFPIITEAMLDAAAKEWGYSLEGFGRRLRQLREQNMVVDIGRPPEGYKSSKRSKRVDAKKAVLQWANSQTALVSNASSAHLFNPKGGAALSSSWR